MITSSVNKLESKLSFEQARKRDALALAQLVYDVFKQRQADGRIENGQNNASQSKEE